MFHRLSRLWHSVVDRSGSDSSSAPRTGKGETAPGSEAAGNSVGSADGSGPMEDTADSTASVYQGAHDGANSRRIYGWVWDATRPDVPVEVDIYDGDTLLATVLADIFRQDLLDGGRGDGRHGFDYPVPAALLDGQPHVIRVTVAGTDFDLKKTPRTIMSGSATAGYRGVHEQADCKRISGWAWDSNRPDTPIDVHIYDGDTLLATVTANKFRQGLLDRGKGNGEHGFVYNTPESLMDGQPHVIRVVFAGIDIELKNTPQTLRCPESAEL